MLPQELAILMNRVDSIGSNGFILKITHEKGSAVGLGRGYDEMNTDLITSTTVMKAFK